MAFLCFCGSCLVVWFDEYVGPGWFVVATKSGFSYQLRLGGFEEVSYTR